MLLYRLILVVVLAEKTNEYFGLRACRIKYESYFGVTRMNKYQLKTTWINAIKKMK